MTKTQPEHSKSQSESIATLARLALRYSGADGYSLYALEHSSGALIAHSSAGSRLPQPEELTVNQSTSICDGRIVRSYPLRFSGSVVGILAFSLNGDSITEQQDAVLDRVAKSIETIYCLPYVAAELFAKVNVLETEIVASKVFARCQGLLAEEFNPEAIVATERHVNTVLRSSRIWAALERLQRESEEELTQRKVTAQAKEVLQKRHGMSEEQAHHFLRVNSRRSRKPVLDIANAVIAQTGATPSRQGSLPLGNG
jgi:ANTAR domain